MAGFSRRKALSSLAASAGGGSRGTRPLRRVGHGHRGRATTCRRWPGCRHGPRHGRYRRALRARRLRARRNRRQRGQRLRPERDPARLRQRDGLELADGRTLREWELFARRQGDRDRARREVRRPGPSTAASPARRCAAPRATACASSFTQRQRAPAHDALPRHPPGRHGRRAGLGEDIGGGLIEPGQSFTYEFDAEPFGLHLYHCHATPLAAHIAKGLYGTFIVDPKAAARRGRRARDGHERLRHELRLRATSSTPSTPSAFHYLNHPIKVKRGELVRIYLVNMLEYDPINSFHLHANFFHYYPTGTSLQPVRVHRHDQPGAGAARDPRDALPVPGQVHVPRPQDRVRRARLDGLLRGRGLMAAPRPAARRETSAARLWLLGLDPARADRRDRRGSSRCSAPPASASGSGPPIEELVVDRSRSTRARSTSPCATTGPTRSRSRRSSSTTATPTSRASTSEIGRLAADTLKVDYPWIEGEAYEITLLTSTGGTIAARDPGRGREPRGRRELLRPDGAARHRTSASSPCARHALAAARCGGRARP